LALRADSARRSTQPFTARSHSVLSAGHSTGDCHVELAELAGVEALYRWSGKAVDARAPPDHRDNVVEAVRSRKHTRRKGWDFSLAVSMT
jgi:hypothetical protein